MQLQKKASINLAHIKISFTVVLSCFAFYILVTYLLSQMIFKTISAGCFLCAHLNQQNENSHCFEKGLDFDFFIEDSINKLY